MRVILIMITGGIPKKSIFASMEAAGAEGEVLMLRILPQVIVKEFEDVEDRDKKRDNRAKAGEMLKECLKTANSLWRTESPPELSTLLREGVPIDIITSLAQSFEPGMLVIPQWDASRMGSFASGDLVALIKKRTSLPVRVVGEHGYRP